MLPDDGGGGGLYLPAIEVPPGDPGALGTAAGTYAAAHGEIERNRAALAREAGGAGDAQWIGVGAQFPVVVAVCTLADGSAEQAPRMYGLAQADQPPRVVVSEVIFPARQPAFGPMHHFALVSLERAGKILATWAAARPKLGLLNRKTAAAQRTVAVYRHRPGAELTGDLVGVSAQAGPLEVSRQRPGCAPEPPLRAELDELADLVTAMLLESSP
jgi:hypothetical protein